MLIGTRRAKPTQRRRTRYAALGSTMLMVGLLLPAGVAGATAASEVQPTRVIVREANPDSDDAERVVARYGGEVTAQLGIIGGFSASIPAASVELVATDPAITTVTADVDVSPQEWGSQQTWGGPSSWDQYGWGYDQGFADEWSDVWGDGWTNAWDDTSHAAPLSSVTRTIGANAYWKAGYTGAGVDVAVIDTGVSSVGGLWVGSRLVNGPDLSFDSQNWRLRYVDKNGHGTHMAGIIGANVGGWNGARGVAHGSRIVNVKVGDRNGLVDVSQVIAALDWVVQHRKSDGLDIRVINLSYGTDSIQDPGLDPLSYAVEQAWKAGIVVVVAAGNDGTSSPLRNPATNPFVIAVGATDTAGTARSSDDTVPEFSSCGTDRTVDVVAPGASVVSLRAPHSVADTDHPAARVGWQFFKGTGTSQAAAAVSGAAALIIDQRPDITPDQVKALLAASATNLGSASAACQGAGEINLSKALDMATPQTTQTHGAATGLGSLDAARGSMRIAYDGQELSGEQDIFGKEWDAASWAGASAAGVSWSGGDWNGSTWTGASWSGASWSGVSWSGVSWSGVSWSGVSWSGISWSGISWSGDGWD